MTDERISDYASLAGASIATGDLVEIVDVSDTTDAATGTNKKTTAGDVATAVGTLLSLASTYQPLDSDLTAIAALTTTAFGRGLLALADAAALRTSAGVVIGTDVEAHDADLTTIAGLTPTNDDVLQRKAGAWTNRTIAQLATDLGLATSYQPLDSDLTSIAALTTTSYGRAFLALADAAAARTAIGVVIGTDVQAYDAELAALAGLTSAADRVPYFTGSGTASLATFTTAGRALVDDADAAAQRTTLGLGTAATAATGDFDAAGVAAALVDDLSGVTDAATARTNLGLGTMAVEAASDYVPSAAAGAGFTALGATTGTTDVHNSASGTVTLDLSAYQSFQVNMSGDVTLAFSNPPATPEFGAWRIKVTGAHTLTLPASVTFSAGTEPTYADPSEYVLFTDAGSTPSYGLQQVGSAFA